MSMVSVVRTLTDVYSSLRPDHMLAVIMVPIDTLIMTHGVDSSFPLPLIDVFELSR